MLTGATGFIGKALLECLVTDTSYTPVAAIRGNYIDFPYNVPSIPIGDISPVTDWSEALSGTEFVIHTAGRAHVLKETADNPLVEYRRINTECTLNLARQAANLGIRRFVFISSIGVNGNYNIRPFTEQDIPNPVEPYAISKLEAEQGLREIAAETGMDVVIIRPPLVYGPEAPGNFGRLMRVVYKGIPLPLGAIHNKRSFVALDNLVDLIVTCIEHPAAANQTFLAGDGEDLSTTDLLRRIGEALGKPARLIPVPARLLMAAAAMLGKRDVAQRLLVSLQVDISKTRE